MKSSELESKINKLKLTGINLELLEDNKVRIGLINKSIKKLIIPEGARTLGISTDYHPFSNSVPEIETIVLPDSLEVIEEGTFAFFEHLKEVKFPKELKIIGQSVFYNCTKLEKVEFNSSLKLIGYMAFRDCAIKGTVKFPESLLRIEDCAFSYNDKIEGLDFSECKHLEYLGDRAFVDCKNLEDTLGFPFSLALKSGSYHVLDGCSKLKDPILRGFATGIYGDLTEKVSEFEAV